MAREMIPLRDSEIRLVEVRSASAAEAPNLMLVLLILFLPKLQVNIEL